MPNYYVKDAHADEKCELCGEPATIVLVSEGYEQGTGYVDEVPLCEECAEKREV